MTLFKPATNLCGKRMENVSSYLEFAGYAKSIDNLMETATPLHPRPQHCPSYTLKLKVVDLIRVRNYV